MMNKKRSIIGSRQTKQIAEKTAGILFSLCGFFAVLAVVSITIYMVISGTPALSKVGIVNILFGTEWMPSSVTPSYGILYVTQTSHLNKCLCTLKIQ